MGYDGIKLHPVAGKCGVFAETDINGLQKKGVPPDELMASLFEAIVLQNLSVLTRGHTLRPHVLLLGGPNYLHPRHAGGLAATTSRRSGRSARRPMPEGVDPRTLIKVPENAQYFAALGAVEFGKRRGRAASASTAAPTNLRAVHRRRPAGGEEGGRRQGPGRGPGRARGASRSATARRVVPRGDLRARRGGARASSASTAARPPPRPSCSTRTATSSCKCYQLSKGNPIEDTMDMFAELEARSQAQGATLEVLGVGTTGYAKDILKDVLGADVALVETVAHTESALHFYPDPTSSCDVGGQDIKLIILQERPVKDFKLNTQCSAGNGYFLQSTAEGFGFAVEEYADIAFSAEAMPDLRLRLRGVHAVRHRRLPAPGLAAGGDPGRPGRRAAEEHLALRLADPEPGHAGHATSCCRAARSTTWRPSRRRSTSSSRASRGKGVDARRASCTSTAASRARSAPPSRPSACGRTAARPSSSAWTRVQDIAYRTHRNEDTRCYFCKNKCLRTFIDVKRGAGAAIDESRAAVEDPAQAGRAAPHRRNSCERGLVEDVNAMREIKKGMDAVKEANPNFVADRRRGRLAQRQPAEGGRPAAAPAAHAGRRRSATSCCQKREDAAHRHPARAEPVLGQPALHRPTSRASASRPRTSSTPTTPPRSSTRRAPSAAPSIPASRPRSASRTCTTCSTRPTRRSRSTSSSSR